MMMIGDPTTVRSPDSPSFAFYAHSTDNPSQPNTSHRHITQPPKRKFGGRRLLVPAE
jgi:hypothetical protein